MTASQVACTGGVQERLGKSSKRALQDAETTSHEPSAGRGSSGKKDGALRGIDAERSWTTKVMVGGQMK